MDWLDVLGILLFCACLFTLVYRRRHWVMPDLQFDPFFSNGPFRDARDRQVFEHVRLEALARRWKFLGMVLGLFLAGVFVILLAHYQPSARSGGDDGAPHKEHSIPAPTGATPPDNSIQPLQLRPSVAKDTLWISAGMTFMIILVGVLLLIGSRKPWAQASGLIAVLLGSLGGVSLVKEVKIGDLFKFETKIDRLGLELQLQRVNQQLAEFGPARIGEVTDFDSGRTEIKPEMKTVIANACSKWGPNNGNQQPGGDKHGMLLIIGSADRVPLAAAIRKQYESNVGLARARAEQVKAQMVACGVAPSQIVTLVSGPANTPALLQHQVPAGFGSDRSVVIWALRNIPPLK